MYELLDYLQTQWSTPAGAAVGSVIACLIFGVVVFGLSKWVNRERQAPDTERRIGRAQPR